MPIDTEVLDFIVREQMEHLSSDERAEVLEAIKDERQRIIDGFAAGLERLQMVVSVRLRRPITVGNFQEAAEEVIAAIEQRYSMR